MTIFGLRLINNLNKSIKVQKDIMENLTEKSCSDKIHSKNCDVTYVGQWKRQLQARVKEHMNNIKLDSSKYFSNISEHIIKHNYNFDWENTKNLDIEYNYIIKD